MFKWFICSPENSDCDKNCIETVKIFISIVGLFLTALIACFVYNLNTKTAVVTCQLSLHKEHVSKILEQVDILNSNLTDFISSEIVLERKELLNKATSNIKIIKSNGKILRKFCNRKTDEVLTKYELSINNLLIMDTDEDLIKKKEIFENFNNLSMDIGNYDFRENCCSI